MYVYEVKVIDSSKIFWYDLSSKFLLANILPHNFYQQWIMLQGTRHVWWSERAVMKYR